jgi:hypothetical protein
VCGYPTFKGDLYGGAHYSESAAATMTPQGRAIKKAGMDFGDGKSLPFTPCKKGYIPMGNGKRMVACPLHNKARTKRLEKEMGRFRKGEVDLGETYWSKVTGSKSKILKADVTLQSVENEIESSTAKHAKESESAVEDVKKLTTTVF